MRALEEQAERSNPVGKKAPKRRGRGVPSTGLSQFRGGASDKAFDKKAARMEAADPSIHNLEEDEMAEMPSGEYDGGAKHSLMDHLKNPLKGFGAYLHELEGGLQTGAYEGEGNGMCGGAMLGRTRKILPGRARKAAPAPAPKAEAVEAPEAAVVGGRKKRAPAGPEDGRRKRAAIVKKVMADKGLSMIAASKFVKEHGLY